MKGNLFQTILTKINKSTLKIYFKQTINQINTKERLVNIKPNPSSNKPVGINSQRNDFYSFIHRNDLKR